MCRKDIIMIRQKELKRLHVIHRVLNGEITQAEASEILSISERRIRRIISRIRQEGDSGIIHKSRHNGGSSVETGHFYFGLTYIPFTPLLPHIKI